VLGDQSGSKLAKLLSDLGNKLRTNEVLHRLLGGGIRVVLDLKLQQEHYVNSVELRIQWY
jgi:hypothetical protein